MIFQLVAVSRSSATQLHLIVEANQEDGQPYQSTSISNLFADCMISTIILKKKLAPCSKQWSAAATSTFSSETVD